MNIITFWKIIPLKIGEKIQEIPQQKTKVVLELFLTVCVCLVGRTVILGMNSFCFLVFFLIVVVVLRWLDVKGFLM